jgi:uncharacterized membrane protein YhhN
MTVSFVPIPLLVIVVILLMRAELREPRDKRQIKLWKPLATLLCLTIAALSVTQPRYDPVYTLLIVIGLLLSLLGDWLLIDADENPRRFVNGLVAFLLAHVAYIIAFTYARFAQGIPFDLTRSAILAALLLVMGGVVYYYLRPSLGSLNQPVLLYVTVISLMVHQAVSGVQLTSGVLAQTSLVAGGALFFYMSDLMLAIGKFVFPDEGRNNSVWVLSTYYTAQMLIALSASFVR